MSNTRTLRATTFFIFLILTDKETLMSGESQAMIECQTYVEGTTSAEYPWA
jgi:hypothetical protein